MWIMMEMYNICNISRPNERFGFFQFPGLTEINTEVGKYVSDWCYQEIMWDVETVLNISYNGKEYK